MSYILDALKKADAQRQRESMPGLHAKPVRIVFARAAAHNARGLWPWAMAAALGVAAAWWLWPGKALVQDRTESRIDATAPAAPVPPAPAAPNQADLASARVDAPAPPDAASPPARSATPQKAATAKEPARAARKPAAAASLPEESSAPVAPPDVPRLQVSGSSYSENPAYRMLILNGRMYREGEEVAPDLLLEQIRPKSAQMKYRGQRYTITY
jgi:general secretion pathway protein B